MSEQTPPRAVPPEDLERLRAIAAALERRQGRAKLSALEGAGMLLVVIAVSLVGSSVTGPLVGLVLGAGAATWAIGAWQRQSHAFDRDELRLGQVVSDIRAIESPRAVGRLLELCGGVGEKNRREVLDAVGRLVSRLDREMIDALTAAQLDSLRELLVPGTSASSHDPEMERRRAVAAILRIMSRRGHQPARREALLLAESWRTVEVHDAARACLARLDELAAAAKLSGSLLRPADAPTADCLLRPAQRVAEEQLRRPASGDHE